MKYKLIFLLQFILFSQLCFGQINPSIKEKLLDMIKSGKLNSTQIRAEIAKAGLSEDQAKLIAKENNVNLDEYLKQEQAAKETVTSPQAYSSELELLHKQIPKREKVINVPTFQDRQGANLLPPFGYNIFQNSPATFEPVINMPTPENYQVGAGDEIILNVWGQTQLTYQLTITRDGYVVIPDVGKIQVEGLTMQEVRQKFTKQMSQNYAGLKQGEPNANTFLDVSLGKLRTIQVFVMGEAKAPGSYILSGMSTVFTALYYAGGPNVNGSLRQLQMMRNDKRISTTDFYDFALYGKKSGDVRLQEGDIIFVPPAGKRVAIWGSILRPAIYELKQGESMSQLITLAGGLQFDAYINRVHVERVVPFTQRTKYQKDLLDLDVQFKSSEEITTSTFQLEDGDVVSIYSINKDRENLVILSGNVNKPGQYELVPDMRVKDLVLKADGYREDTFLERAIILRIRPEDLKKEVVSFNLNLALQNDEKNNIKLQRLDSVVVFKAEYFHPLQTVTITGAVKNPGIFPRVESMTVADLIILAGGTVTGADLSTIELARLDTTSDRQISTIIHSSLPEDYWNIDRSQDMKLMDFDIVSVRMKHQFKPSKTVTVSGEAIYPGVYAIQYEGEKINNLITRFGGFKSTAYLEGVRFTRSPQIGGIVTQDITNYVGALLDSVGKPIPMPQRTAGDDVPIDIYEVLNDSDSKANLELQGGDEIVIPRDPGVVYVQGQVNLPSSVPYKKGASLEYYLKQAGGITENGDESKTIVILPNRQKWEESGFFLVPDPEILSGSTIIVPFQMKERTMTLQILREWASISLSTASVAILLWQVLK
jgi:protein involved in polysaccharide export with SLBB domain